MTESRRLVVGISGATGIAYGVRVLELARKAGVETHLVVTPAGQQTRAYETDLAVRDLAAMADVSYRPADIGAAIASGSFRTAGMLVAPVLDPDPVGDRLRQRRQPADPRRRRDAERAATPGADGQGDAADAGASAGDDRGDRIGRNRHAAGPGLLPAAREVWTTSSTTPSAAPWICSISTSPTCPAGASETNPARGTDCETPAQPARIHRRARAHRRHPADRRGSRLEPGDRRDHPPVLRPAGPRAAVHQHHRLPGHRLPACWARPAPSAGPPHPLARIALALGLPADAAGQDIMEAIVAARTRPGIPPVASGRRRRRPARRTSCSATTSTC